MADVEVECSGCGKKVVLSEFADISATLCSTCGGNYRLPFSETEPDMVPRLSVLRRGPGEAVNLRGESVAPKPVFEHAERVIPNSVVEESGRKRSTGRLLGSFVLLLSAALFVAPQACADRYPLAHAGYLQGRLYALAAIWIGVCVEAWRESAGRGVLATLFPPYIIPYALGRVERPWLRALVLSAVLMLAAELHFLGSAALLRQAQVSVNRGIQSVGNLLQRASDPVPTR